MHTRPWHHDNSSKLRQFYGRVILLQDVSSDLLGMVTTDV
jgi:hypothetical protein